MVKHGQQTESVCHETPFLQSSAIAIDRIRPYRPVRMLQGSATRPLISVGWGFVQQSATYVPRELHGERLLDISLVPSRPPDSCHAAIGPREFLMGGWHTQRDRSLGFLWDAKMQSLTVYSPLDRSP